MADLALEQRPAVLPGLPRQLPQMAEEAPNARPVIIQMWPVRAAVPKTVDDVLNAGAGQRSRRDGRQCRRLLFLWWRREVIPASSFGLDLVDGRSFHWFPQSTRNSSGL